MNFFLLIIVSILLIGCITKNVTEKPEVNKHQYLIKKIVSLTDSLHVVYAWRADSLYKIVSVGVTTASDCETLEVNHYYTLNISSVFDYQFGIQMSKERRAVMLRNISTYSYGGILITLDKESNRDIYRSDNIVGRCYLK